MGDDNDEVGGLLEVDPFLLAIAVTLNSGDVENTMGLTVTVAGGTVTGEAIAFDRWRQLVEKSLSTSMGYRGEALANVFDGLQRTLELGLLQSNQPDDPDSPPPPQMPRYLHLANARFLEAPTWGPGMLWRCRLDAVIAWSVESPLPISH